LYYSLLRKARGGGRGEEEHLLMGLGKSLEPPIRQGRKRIKKKK
jgi:hypothetical protein